jgi:hypothetical protein
MAPHALPLYALREATSGTALQPFLRWLPAGRAACGHLLPPSTPHAVRLWQERRLGFGQARMARGIHGLPKVLPGPAMPDLSTPSRRATPKRPYTPQHI